MIVSLKQRGMQILTVIFVGALCQGIGDLARAEDPDLPWSVNEQFPVLDVSVTSASEASRQDKPEEMGRLCSFVWLKIYQNTFSVVMTSHCPLYPSCSNYSLLAISRYGSLKGIMLTADRLIHESTEARDAPVVQTGGRSLCYDPVEANVAE